MSKQRWEQIGAAGGILFVILQLAGQALIQVGGAEPAFTAPAGEIMSFFMARDPMLARIGGFLSNLSAIAILFFLGTLWAALSRREESPSWMSMVVFGSGIAAVAVTLGGGGWELALLRIDEGLDPATARMLFDQGNLNFAVFWVPLASMLLATGVAVIRDGALPGWFGWFSLIASIALLVSRAFWTAPSGMAFIGYMLFWIWLIIASILLIRRV
jgi:hypothetical protein